MGVASIVASLVYGSNHGSDFTERMLRDAMLYIGMDMLRTSQVRKQEIELHRSQLEELNSSFDDEIKPVVVQIQGTEHRLTGTADAQYQEWRDLLRRIFIDEGGAVPDDFTVYAGEPEPSAPRQDPLPTLGPPASSISLAPPVLAVPADGATPSAAPADAVAPTDAPAPAEPAPAQAVSDAPASVANGG
jgi:hypothetical protein